MYGFGSTLTQRFLELFLLKASFPRHKPDVSTFNSPKCHYFFPGFQKLHYFSVYFLSSELYLFLPFFEIFLCLAVNYLHRSPPILNFCIHSIVTPTSQTTKKRFLFVSFWYLRLRILRQWTVVWNSLKTVKKNQISKTMLNTKAKIQKRRLKVFTQQKNN